ncbi:probable DEAD-box ATP-dependent RNA helicase 48, partial [Phalaenopsis equestris]|uniref:probable DEAD-box ATP-dependent RNA helicase 48 n=1 Tax=Phalaenopsis equestris TaxID=78828 RepID=UPI0009E37D58
MPISALRHRSKSLPKLLCNLSLIRTMGGGPRTFPGGLNKWQYKRMHEKLAREKEHRLLQQEKQIYQARLRSEIRAKFSAKSASDDFSSAGGMSSKDHIRALADRFMKEGAEDLWNEDDGPIKSRTHARPSNIPPPRPLDLRKIVTEKRGSIGSFDHRRNYSKWSRNFSSDEGEDDSFVRFEGGLLNKFQGRVEGLRVPRFSLDEEDSEKDLNRGDGGHYRKRMLSGAALRNYDVKMDKRRPPKPDIEESDWSRDIREFHQELRNRASVKNDINRQEVDEGSILTQKRFDEYNISPLTIQALNFSGYVNMTIVQEAALPVCLDGKDALVKAKTGTGKRAAFLLPAIEAVVRASSTNSTSRVPPILVLIISPTRELAIQLAAEANVLLRYHNGVGLQTLIGGTRFKLDQKRLEENPCQIIVATPGRLLDHIENKSGFSVRLMGLKMLILDEADHLLDLGFRKDIEKIVDCIPRQRQSMLFSATIPKEVRRISQLVLKRDHFFVDTVGLGNVETHDKVVQLFLVAPHELHFHLVYQLLNEHTMKVPDYKVIVFCTTAMVTAFMHVLLRDLKMNVREMHSRKPQLYRTRISEEFREAKCLTLVTSDVSSRGMNYPDVTLVIQVGIPTDREQYIHRLGRTGREGKTGKGILLLAPWEEYFINEIKDLPIERCQLPELGSDVKQKVEQSIEKIDLSIKEAAYHAWLGYYNSIADIGRDKTALAELAANRFCRSIGLDRPPALFRRTALKMGLKGI